MNKIGNNMQISVKNMKQRIEDLHKKGTCFTSIFKNQGKVHMKNEEID